MISTTTFEATENHNRNKWYVGTALVLLLIGATYCAKIWHSETPETQIIDTITDNSLSVSDKAAGCTGLLTAVLGERTAGKNDLDSIRIYTRSFVNDARNQLTDLSVPLEERRETLASLQALCDKFVQDKDNRSFGEELVRSLREPKERITAQADALKRITDQLASATAPLLATSQGMADYKAAYAGDPEYSQLEGKFRQFLSQKLAQATTMATTTQQLAEVYNQWRQISLTWSTDAQVLELTKQAKDQAMSRMDQLLNAQNPYTGLREQAVAAIHADVRNRCNYSVCDVTEDVRESNRAETVTGDSKEIAVDYSGSAEIKYGPFKSSRYSASITYRITRNYTTGQDAVRETDRSVTENR
jgi:hypothetical protein